MTAVSRKAHGTAGTFDIPLPLTGNPGIERRSGGSNGSFRLVLTFPKRIMVGKVAVTSGVGGVSSFWPSGPTATINLTGVADAQKIVITAPVSDGTNIGLRAVAVVPPRVSASADQFHQTAFSSVRC
jgi:hypothetical protein